MVPLIRGWWGKLFLFLPIEEAIATLRSPKEGGGCAADNPKPHIQRMTLNAHDDVFLLVLSV